MLPSSILYGAIHSNGEIDTQYMSSGLSKFTITHIDGHYNFKLKEGRYQTRPIVLIQQYDVSGGNFTNISKVTWSSDNTTFAVIFVDPNDPKISRLTAFQVAIIGG